MKIMMKLILLNSTIKGKKQGNSIILSIIVLLLVITVIFSITGIYINKLYSLKNINNYYDRKIYDILEKYNILS